MTRRTNALSFTRALLAAAAIAAAGCGDDTVNPSNPDAGPTKDATVEGGDGGAADATPGDDAVDASAQEAADAGPEAGDGSVDGAAD